MNTRIALPVAVSGMLLATVLAGCSDDTPVNDEAAATTSAAASSAAAVASSEAPGGASPSVKGGSSAATAGCPVNAATLEKAFRANAKVASAVVLGKGLKDVSCYGGWATAVTQPTNLEPAVVLFKYDAAKKTWAALVGGTDGVCRDNVPADAATHLKGCQN
ncbi:hypothetical protein ABT297_06385 [Dactylosporangium sp. NPDC000555]|uniref:hypothetical protein n=1 Tax=Dactylosporangium sp. NPDC000555 TaxID=3154260 RepID=UPI00331742C5